MQLLALLNGFPLDFARLPLGPLRLLNLQAGELGFGLNASARFPKIMPALCRKIATGICSAARNR